MEGDCLTVWEVCLPSNDSRKGQDLHQVSQDAMRSENDKASHAGLPLPYSIMAGDMNAALCNQDVQINKLDMTKTVYQNRVMQTRHQSWPKYHSPA